MAAGMLSASLACSGGAHIEEKWLHGYVAVLYSVPQRPRNDEELSGHVHSRQVVAWVRLGDACGVRMADDVAEPFPGVEAVRNELQCARKNTLHTRDGVAGIPGGRLHPLEISSGPK